MLRPRVIPCLLLKDKGLVKTTRFEDPRYVGDPINAIKIFNEKNADELIFLDINAAAGGWRPQLDVIEKIATECLMPVCYGGGINNIETISRILSIGIEKISISSHAVKSPYFIKDASREFGSQSIVVCLDVKKTGEGRYEVVTGNAKERTKIEPLEFALKMQDMGAGELLINSVDRDGTMSGYDIELIRTIAESVKMPVIACGGAGSLNDIQEVIVKGKASAAAVGSLFVFYGRLRAVLINYPKQEELESLF